jgi:hypothetical protein
MPKNAKIQEKNDLFHCYTRGDPNMDYGIFEDPLLSGFISFDSSTKIF